MRVLVLGAGFGGLELTTRLSEEFGGSVEVVLIDRAEAFVLGFSKLDVLFGRAGAEAVRHPYRDLVKPGVRFVQTAVRSIDPTNRRVVTDTGSFDADVMVVALGADVDPAATPGLVEGGHPFYTLAGAVSARDALQAFGGGSVIVGATSTPWKCTPAPSEVALMAHEYLTERGQDEGSEVTLVLPVGVPVPPSPAASEALLTAFAERGITWRPNRSVRALDPARKAAVLDDGEELPYDLYLGVPVHRAPEVVLESGLCVDGWVPVNPITFETNFPGVYAVGDVTGIGAPKAGAFAQGQAGVVADEIIAKHLRRQSESYDGTGHGVCYVEFGRSQVGRINVTFRVGEPPAGEFEGPSLDHAADKSAFGSSRIKRWFGRDWTSH